MNEITEALEQNRKAQEQAAFEGNAEAVAALKRSEAELLKERQNDAAGFEWPPMASTATH